MENKKGAKNRSRNRNSYLHCDKANCIMAMEKKPFRSDKVPKGCHITHCIVCTPDCLICEKGTHHVKASTGHTYDFSGAQQTASAESNKDQCNGFRSQGQFSHASQ